MLLKEFYFVLHTALASISMKSTNDMLRLVWGTERFLFLNLAYQAASRNSGKPDCA